MVYWDYPLNGNPAGLRGLPQNITTGQIVRYSWRTSCFDITILSLSRVIFFGITYVWCCINSSRFPLVLVMGVSIPLLATKAALFDYCRDDGLFIWFCLPMAATLAILILQSICFFRILPAWKAEEWKKHYGEMLQGTPHSSDYLCHLLVSPTSSEGEDSRLRVPPMAITTISPVMNKCDAALLDIVHATVNICNNASVKSEWQWHDVASDQLAQLSTDGETAVVALGVWTRKVKVPVENYVFGKVPSREVAM